MSGFDVMQWGLDQERTTQDRSLDSAAKVNPGMFGEAVSVAKQLGRPVSLVAKDLDLAKSVLFKSQVSNDSWRKRFPLFAQKLQDVDFVSMIRDDKGSLEVTEGTLDWISRSWRVARNTSRRGTIGTMAGLSGRELTAYETREVDRMDELSQAHGERDNGFTGSAVELAGSMIDTVATAVAAGAMTTAVGAPQAAPFVAGAAAFGQSMRLEAGNLYVDLLAQGYTPAEAQPIAGWFGAAIGAVEVVGLKIAGKPFKETAKTLLPNVFARGLTQKSRTEAFKAAAKGYGVSLLSEPTTEAIQERIGQAGKELARVQYGKEDVLGSQYDMGEVGQAFTHTLKGMVVLGGLGAGGHYIGDMKRAADSKHTTRVWKAQDAARNDSKWQTRDPEGRAEFINEKLEGTPADTVYVRGDKFAEVLEQADSAEAAESGRSTVMESLEQLVPGISAKIKEAQETGGDISISAGDFDAKLADTDIGKALMDHATIDPDGMTAAEAATWEKVSQAEAQHWREQTEENMAIDKGLAESARAVEDIMYAELQDSGVLSSKDSRTSSQLYRDFVVTQAADLNISPEEFHARYPLVVKRGASTDADPAFHQGEIFETDGFLSAQVAGGLVGGHIENGALRITNAEVSTPGQGIGGSLYRQLVDEAHGRGLRVFSDYTVEEAAVRVYESMGREGYVVEDIRAGTLDDGAAFGKGVNTPAFEVKPKPALFRQDGQRNTDTPEFKEFIDGTQVVDESGAPLVVYHGDPDASWTEWNPSGNSRGDHKGGAFFATASPELASDYAYQASQDPEIQDLVTQRDELQQQFMRAAVAGDTELRNRVRSESKALTDQIVNAIFKDGDRSSNGGGVYPVFLSIVNPLVVDGRGRNHRDVNEAAIDEAKANGHDGVIINNVVDNARIERGPQTVYVAFDPTQIKSTNNRGTFDRTKKNILHQDEDEAGAPPRGEFLPTGSEFHEKLTVLLGEKADASTFLHESAHYFLTVYSDLAAQPNAPARVVADMDKLLASFGVEDVHAWNAMTLKQQREHHEAFAYNFERYLFDGKAPSAELLPLYQRFSAWIRRAYRNIRDNIGAIYRREFKKELPILTGEVRSVMDRMLASEEQIAAAEHVRSMVPLFQTQEESGLSDAEWSAYQTQSETARNTAIDDLTQKSLANMKWLSRARARVLKEKQAEANDVREAIRTEVQAEVQQRPVYKAMHYLKRGEKRNADGTSTEVEGATKLDKDMVETLLGKGPKKPRKKRRQSLTTFVASKGGISHSSWTKTYPGNTKGEFRIPGVFRGKAKDTDARGTTGMPWDQMAVLARENGYGPQVTEGVSIENEDVSWFVEAIADAAQGNHTYTEESADRKAAAETIAAADAEREASRKEKLKRLGSGKFGMLQKGGEDPQNVAGAYGFPTGSALVEALLSSPKFADAVDAETDARMTSEHSDLVDPDQIILAVESAVHNEARARFLTIELKALAKATQPTQLMTAAAKEAARQIIASKTIRELRPREFSIAEARHGREAFKAIQAGDTAAAIIAKQKQLVQNQLAKQATEAQLEVTKGNKSFRRVFTSDVKLAKTRDVNIIQAARAVLTLYDLGQASRSPLEWLKPVAEYDPLTFADIEGDVAFAIEQSRELDPGEKKVPAKWKSLTLDQYRGLTETIDALWQKSRRTKQVFLDGKRQSRDAVAELGREQLDTLPAKKRLAGNKGTVDEAKDGIRSYVAMSKRAEFVARDLDGGKAGVFTSLFRRVKEAANAFREAARAELDIYENRLRDHDFGPDIAIDGTRFLLDGNERATHSGVFKNKAELLGVMQHLGNDSNKKKALVSEGWAEAREDKTVDTAVWDAFEQEMIRTGVLVKADYDFLQAVWDQAESHKASLQKAHYENHGYHWREIEAKAFTVRFLDGSEQRYRGGYVPAKADPKRVPSAANHEVNTKAELQSALPMSPRGMTKDRNENYVEVQVHDLNQTGRHLVEVLRYVHMQSAATDVNRVLTHKPLAKALQAYDPNLLRDVFTPWLKRAATQQVAEVGSNPAFRMLARVASNTNMGIMFANVGNSLQNFTGLVEAMSRVKPKHVLSALTSYVFNGAKMREQAMKSSSELRGRQGRQMVEVAREIRKQIAGAGKVRRGFDWLRENAYFMQTMTQNVVDTVVWTAGYNQALSKGQNEQESIRQADAVVRQTQMATDPEDVSQWEAQGSGSGGFVRALFPFQSWFIRWANNQSSNWKNADEAGGRFAAMLYGYGLTMILAQLVSDAVNGRIEDEDDDGWGDDAADLAMRSLIGGTLAAVPVFGKPVASLANTWMDDDVWNDRMPAPPFISAFERARQALASETMTDRQQKDLVTFFGNATGVPLGPLMSRFDYAARTARGETEPDGPLGETFDTVRGLVTGRGR